MAEQKKRTSIWMEPHVMRELKFLGVEHGRPVGDVIEALLHLNRAAKQEWLSDCMAIVYRSQVRGSPEGRG
jgi:hypothetical protein